MQKSIEFFGNPEKCLILVNLSSSAAAIILPSFTIQAEVSAWKTLTGKGWTWKGRTLKPQFGSDH